ncbi:MAG: GntR family transcriptional regulator [Planctomycetota bacterium]
MDIRVDADSGVPLYQQVAHQIRLAVLGGGLKSGERLPSVRELSERLKINPLTVGRAYAELERMKLTVSRWGSGNFVAEMVPAGVEEAGNRVLETLVDRFVREALPLAGDKRKLVRLVEDRTRREPV